MNTIANIGRSVTYAYKLGWKYTKFELSTLLVLQIISGLAPLALLSITQKLVNGVVNLISDGEGVKNVIILFLLQIFIVYVLYVFQHLNIILDKKVKNVIGEKVSETIFDKSNKIPFIHFENPETQNFLQRISSSQSQLLSSILESSELLKNIISVVSVLGFLVSKHWSFIVILFLGMVPLLLVEMVFGKKRYELVKFLTPTGRMESYIGNLLTERDSIKEVRLFALFKYLTKKWRSNYRSYVGQELKVTVQNSKFGLLAEFFLILTYTATGILVIYFITIGRFMVGSFVAILQAIQTIQDQLSACTRNLSALYENALFIEDYRSFLSLDEERQMTNEQALSSPVEKVEVKNLSFTYPTFDKPVLHDISFDISKGKKMAIIGSNGSGKTTLMKCLAGLFSPTKGEILVNGLNLESIPKGHYQDRVSILFQDFQKYSFTAKENIGFGRIDKIDDQDHIINSSKVSGMHDYIGELNGRYDAMLGRLFEGGQDLSGGQWQKIGLARALFRSGDFLILDEPTSSLDPISEVNIIKKLLNDAKDESILFVTHRLNFTHLLDEIIVMKEGSIIERGTHDELMDRGGEYFDLYHAQLMLNQREEVLYS
ncbi:ABC transporter ATP-binding protein [Rossellomorea marisflavi]|uniref:ABC transporter ATP-binding protein n=1 Tax=Rossellomorea marisflavi TaxID=189381 RepID=UPI003459C4AC